MLSGKLVRVRHARNRILPVLIDPSQETWIEAAERLLLLFRSFNKATRGEIAEEVSNVIGDQPSQVVHQGLAKLLEDRCEFEVDAAVEPEKIREAIFRAAAVARGAGSFDRAEVLRSVAEEHQLTAEQVEQSLFADLKDEQRLLHFEDLSVPELLNRYNVALAQAILLRATGVEVKVSGETTARYRQLAHAMKFHRLICQIQTLPGGYLFRIDGPLSLFSSTQKYGLQLASFLGVLLHCKHFELEATVRWGAQRKEKIFKLSSADGLRSYLQDRGDGLPRDLLLLLDSFEKYQDAWKLRREPELLPMASGFWTPDFELFHRRSGRSVFVEILGFWRSPHVVRHLEQLDRDLKVPYLVALSEQLNVDESLPAEPDPRVYLFKRAPLASEIIRRATMLLE